jgi:LuxR family maltose regulon positive regulatory protein
MDLYIHSVTQAVLDWLASLNPQVLDAHPQLRVRAAALSLMAGQTTGVEAHIQAAEKALQGVELNESIRDLFGQMACARATLALTRYDPAEMIRQARIALEYLHPGNLSFRFTANWALASASLLQGDRLTAAQACRDGLAISQQSGDMFSIILATSDLGTIQELDAQLFQAEETYLHALELSGEHPQPNMGEVHLGLARIYYEWNDLETAEKHGKQSLELTRLYDREIDRFIISEVFLARLELARGEVNRAADMLAKTEQTARKKNFTLRLPEIAEIQVLVLLRQGKLSAAAELAHQFDLPLCKARILLTQGDLSGALSILGAFRQQMETRGWEEERLRALVLQAISLHQNDERDLARQTLAETLTLAAPNGFIRLFVDEGEVMRLMISDLRFSNKKSTHISNQNILSYTDRLLATFVSGTKNQLQMTQPSSLVTALSQRELEILQLIAQGFSNQEIGEKLFLALDTVKGHNRRIYNKLQVQRRTEAIARARELGLL